MSKGMTARADECRVTHAALPHEAPHQQLKVPRHLFPLHRFLSDKVPCCLSTLIIEFACDTGPRSKINAAIIHDYDVASRFYRAVVYSGMRVCSSLMWLPQPYWHPLRDRAIDLFIDFSKIPWVPEQDVLMRPAPS